MRAQPLTWRRLTERASAAAVVVAVVAAVAETLATVAAGQVAEHLTAGLVGLLAALLVGGTLLDTAARTTFSGVVGRAEGTLRADLLHAALHQPLPALEEQAVGEVLDRVDDDARQVGVLLRRSGWGLGRAATRSVLA
ncbi:ABC transporter transmembrane domain-containing protein [Pseudonocardia nigra]|uniref:ABC transporter transmembrane domain-containing protein n=1 Tax=Pseudonocardia nigra TaxID=1921578 RepID=UPI001C5DCC38|nr:ABC transporter transmembrane domain-containing protein [Pseudonocardia nigra]